MKETIASPSGCMARAAVTAASAYFVGPLAGQQSALMDPIGPKLALKLLNSRKKTCWLPDPEKAAGTLCCCPA
jgi:hypothetical protein